MPRTVHRSGTPSGATARSFAYCLMTVNVARALREGGEPVDVRPSRPRDDAAPLAFSLMGASGLFAVRVPPSRGRVRNIDRKIIASIFAQELTRCESRTSIPINQHGYCVRNPCDRLLAPSLYRSLRLVSATTWCVRCTQRRRGGGSSLAVFGLVNGGFHGASCWDRLVPDLAALGHEAAAMDMPIDEPDATLPDDVDAVAEALPPIDVPVILVGHSLGGTVIPQRRAIAAGVSTRVLVRDGAGPAERRPRSGPPGGPDDDFRHERRRVRR